MKDQSKIGVAQQRLFHMVNFLFIPVNLVMGCSVLALRTMDRGVHYMCNGYHRLVSRNNPKPGPESKPLLNWQKGVLSSSSLVNPQKPDRKSRDRPTTSSRPSDIKDHVNGQNRGVSSSSPGNDQKSDSQSRDRPSISL